MRVLTQVKKGMAEMSEQRAGTHEEAPLLEVARLLLRRLEASPETPNARDSELFALCAGAFAMGLVRGRWGKLEFMGVPLDLGAGALLQLAGLSGMGGEQKRVVRTLAQGALATYFATWGATVGSRMKLGKPAMPAALSFTTSAGSDGARSAGSSAAGLTDTEVLDSIRALMMNES